jgi:hypothetical protein
MRTRERRERRAERLREWSDKRKAKLDSQFKAAHNHLAGIEPGQPILVGHHSEKRHRRAIEKHDNALRKAFESKDLAESMASRADNLERELEHAIYDDDPDAIEQLRTRMQLLEMRRARIKAINAVIRQCGYMVLADVEHQWEDGTLVLDPPMTANERAELLQLARFSYHDVEHKGYPPYVLANLNGNLAKTRKRLAYLEDRVSAQAQAVAQLADDKMPSGVAVADAETTSLLERAGLVITAGMTTPQRAGKKPRPVWTVSGPVARFENLLRDCGGKPWRGTWSFWDDPTDDLEAALRHEVTKGAAR